MTAEEGKVDPMHQFTIEPAFEAARFLIAMAAYAWKTEEGDYRDDITAVVVYLDEAVRQMESS